MVTFVGMKRKLNLSNAFLGLLVLFSILFQSIHAIEHLAKQFSEGSCYHKYSDKATLNHSHYWEKCHVCEFAFSNYTEIIFAEISFLKNPIFCQLSFYHSKDKINCFSGSSFSLRGPPIV
jgi:hypothetical protein